MKEIFKPLRNFLRQLDQLSFLTGIYFLSNHLEWKNPLPDYLKAANPSNLTDVIRLGFHHWEFDTLAREVILYSPTYGGRQPAWRDFAKAINLLKWTENEAFGRGDFDVFAEMTRIAHRQFHWQQGVSHADITRYRRIYRQPGLNELMMSEFGVSSEQYFLGSFALIATFMKHFAFAPEFVKNLHPTLGFSIGPLVERLTTTLPALREKTLDTRRLDIDWAYTFHPMWAQPLIRIPDGRTICPIPGLLTRRLTEGVYFDFARNQDNLSRHLGPAFQAYIGSVLEAANQGGFTILPETEFGPPHASKRSVDWIVEDNDAVLFIECKVLRLAHAGRSELAPTDGTEREFRKLAKAIGQTYASLKIALEGGYPQWAPSEKPVFPVIVTMDNWNLFTHVALGRLREMVLHELEVRDVDQALLDAHPFTICVARELELGSQVMHAAGILPVMKGITGEKLGYQFSGYLGENFKAELASAGSLFPDDPSQLVAEFRRSRALSSRSAQ